MSSTKMLETPVHQEKPAETGQNIITGTLTDIVNKATKVSDKKQIKEQLEVIENGIKQLNIHFPNEFQNIDFETVNTLMPTVKNILVLLEKIVQRFAIESSKEIADEIRMLATKIQESQTASEVNLQKMKPTTYLQEKFLTLFRGTLRRKSAGSTSVNESLEDSETTEKKVKREDDDELSYANEQVITVINGKDEYGTDLVSLPKDQDMDEIMITPQRSQEDENDDLDLPGGPSRVPPDPKTASLTRRFMKMFTPPFNK